MAELPPAIGAMLRMAAEAMQRGDGAAALRVLAEAQVQAPHAEEVHLNTALVLRSLGDLAGAIAAIDRVLVRQPHHAIALMTKGSLLEATAGPREAAIVYRQALRALPQTLPPALRQAAEHASRLVAEDAAALQARMRAQTDGLRGSASGAALDRFDQSLDGLAGVAPVAVQRPMLLRYAQMPAIPFHDRALFPWLEELEAATAMIAAELRAAMDQARQDFVPYIQYPANVAVNQWGELNHSLKWNSYFLYKDGVRHEDACARCPGTAALIDRLPLMRQPGFAPTAVFSALQPRTHIPPHTGATNTRLLCHLPLILPGPARFRVGPVVRDWRLGQAWVFDDTIEHEAWNDADETRVVLILDLWSPLISEPERALIGAMMTARSGYYGA